MANLHQLQAPLTAIKGIGPQKYKLFLQLGLRTIEDLIFHYPHRYEDRSVCSFLASVDDGFKGLFKVVVVGSSSARIKGNQTLTKVAVDDGTAKATLAYMNIGYIAQQFEIGQAYWIYGTVTKKGKALSLFHAEFKPVVKHPDGFGIVPVYPLTEGLSLNEIYKALSQVRNYMAYIEETLPVQDLGLTLMAKGAALEAIHFPNSLEELKHARQRLIYEEFFHLQMALLIIKEKVGQVPKSVVYQKIEYSKVADLFPFVLTEAQRAVIDQIYDDMDSPLCMNRLLQGDVGSGKTAVAMAAAYKCALSGFQVAVLAPTEILAKQHALSFERILADHTKVGLLTGSTTAKQKQQVLEEIATGVIQIVIGTHALIEDAVQFKGLKLVITDEQHRFGVGQRQLAANKGAEPLDVLVMSATPIPRTLSLILYGDVNMSIIDQSPVGRLPIKTHYIKPDKMTDMHQFILSRLNAGEQAYFVAPLIEESEALDLVSAVQLFEQIGPYYEAYGIALLHGRMKGKEKDEIMARFKTGQIKVLVATTVIEVGVDVPMATVMVITHAERFGLAQLHQLRGRVGRSHLQSTCFLVSDAKGPVAKKRIGVMVATNDGFEIANQDLELRGPGEIIGLKQHGVPEFKIADLVKHTKLLARAQADAKLLVAKMGADLLASPYAAWLSQHLTL